MRQINKFIKRNVEVATKQIENELIILSLDESRIYTFNEVAKHIWELADGTQSLGEIIQQIASEYSASQEQVKKDILAFLEKANLQFNLFSFSESPSF